MAFGALLLFIIAIAYGNTLNSPLNFDDSLVLKTEIAQAGEKYFDLSSPRYRHLFYLSLAINYSLGKLNPFVYHLLNISLHFLTSLVIFFISYLTVKRGTAWAPQAAPVAVMTTLFFALSPVHTETVTYISGRSSGLAGFFYFSSLLFFILGSSRDFTRVSRSVWYLLSGIFFGGAVLTKEISLTLPILILLYDFCFIEGDSWSSRKNRCMFFYFPLLICTGLGSFLMKAMILDWLQKIDFNYALDQTRIIGHGLYLLLFPIGLTFDYDFPEGFFPHRLLKPWPILLLGLFLAGAVKYFPKYAKFIFFCVFWFLITISPTNSFMPRLDLLSERNLYIPSFGIFFLLSTVFIHFYRGLKFNTVSRKICLAGLIAILISHSTLVLERNLEYGSNTALWEDTVKKAPRKTRAWHNLSHFYLMELNYEKAFEALQGMIKSSPSNQYLAYAQSKLGTIYSRKGNYKGAITAYKKGIELDPTAPINHLNLGGVFVRQGNFLQALKEYETAEQLFKKNPVSKNIPSSFYRNKAQILQMMRQNQAQGELN